MKTLLIALTLAVMAAPSFAGKSVSGLAQQRYQKLQQQKAAANACGCPQGANGNVYNPQQSNKH